MEKKNRFPLFVVISLLAILIVVFFMHGASDIAVLNPKGWVGWEQRNLILKVSFVMLLVVIPVVVLTIYFGWKYREGNREALYEPEWDDHRGLEALWWGVPLIIITVFGVWTWTSSHRLDPYKPLDSDLKPLRIQVVALDWKWLFIYPEEEIATVNFIQFPENRPLSFEITSDAPMNSFWIPELGGQIYAMAGMKTRLHLIANHRGSYRGVSSNISGEGFAGMTFTAKASSELEFEEWIRFVKESPLILNQNEYQKLMQPSSYDPVRYYVLQEENLFDSIVMKYMMPMGKNQ